MSQQDVAELVRELRRHSAALLFTLSKAPNLKRPSTFEQLVVLLEKAANALEALNGKSWPESGILDAKLLPDEKKR